MDANGAPSSYNVRPSAPFIRYVPPGCHMTLTKIPDLDYRIFRGYKWPKGLHDFAKLNLIYGWNGSGKTTLSDVFSRVAAKQSLPSGRGTLQFGDAKVSTLQLKEAAIPPIRVFNRDTVSRSVFEEQEGELPPVFYLGEKTVEEKATLAKLQAERGHEQATLDKAKQKRAQGQKALDDLCQHGARQVKNLLTRPGGGPYNNYNKGHFAATAAKLAAKPPVALTANEREALVAQAQPGTEATVAAMVVPTDPQDHLTAAAELLARAPKSAKAAGLQDAKVAVWVQDGLHLHSPRKGNAACLFCTQGVPAARWTVLDAHFNDEVADLQREIDESQQEIADIITEYEAYPPTVHSSLFIDLAKPFKVEADQARALATQVNATLKEVNRQLKEKKRAPHEAVTLDADVSSTMTALAAHDVKLQGLLAKHNERVKNVKATSAAAQKGLEEDEVVSCIKEYSANQKAITAETQRAAAATTRLDELDGEIDQATLALREHQRPAAELDRELADYLGRDELRFKVQDTGYTITRNGAAATHLSEGERTAIAFMYFLKSLNDTSFDRKNGIVVIDDPVSSLDANSLYHAFGFMKARTADARQVIILTHNFGFFRQVRNWFQHEKGQHSKDPAKRPARFFMLVATYDENGRKAQLEQLDPLLEQFDSEYHFLFKEIHSHAATPGPTSMDASYRMPNMARRLLETFLAFKVPDISGELHVKLETFKDYDVAKRTRIIRFLHTHSHGDSIGEPEHDLTVLAETPEILREVLGFIEHHDKDHYTAMVRKVTTLPAEHA